MKHHSLSKVLKRLACVLAALLGHQHRHRLHEPR